MKEAYLFNKWYCNKYEQEYRIVLFIGVEVLNITVYFSRKHNFWTYHNKLSQVQYSKYFFLMLNRNTSHQKYSYYTNYCAVKKNVHPLLNEPPNTKNLLCWYFADIPSEKFFTQQVAHHEIKKSFLFNICGITYSYCFTFFAVIIEN